jgi:hypothetical protein
MDLTQNLDKENDKKRTKAEKRRGVADKDCDDIGLYFELPTRGKDKVSYLFLISLSL